jgi:hypothetical protein
MKITQIITKTILDNNRFKSYFDDENKKCKNINLENHDSDKSR